MEHTDRGGHSPEATKGHEWQKSLKGCSLWSDYEPGLGIREPFIHSFGGPVNQSGTLGSGTELSSRETGEPAQESLCLCPTSQGEDHHKQGNYGADKAPHWASGTGAEGQWEADKPRKASQRRWHLSCHHKGRGSRGRGKQQPTSRARNSKAVEDQEGRGL